MSVRDVLAACRMALELVMDLSTEEPVKRLAGAALKQAQAILEAPSPDAIRQRRFREKHGPPKVTLGNVTSRDITNGNGGGVGGALSLISGDQEIQREERESGVTARNVTSRDKPARRIRHKYPETLAPDPEDTAAFATWCLQWGFATTDESVRAMARWHSGKGSVWRDWKQALRTWKSKERPSGSYPTRAPLQQAPATGRVWKVGQ